ncbi:hypothetical protein MIR68_002201 [Amoeboaphelidium protococcarum]|nr:hypothetical protein MIR68_002201 [Amoeboaphelidium protococcarum]
MTFEAGSELSADQMCTSQIFGEKFKKCWLLFTRWFTSNIWVNSAVLLLLAAVVVSGAIVFLILVGAVTYPSIQYQNQFYEINCQILTVIFTLAMIVDSPKRFAMLFYTIRGLSMQTRLSSLWARQKLSSERIKLQQKFDNLKQNIGRKYPAFLVKKNRSQRPNQASLSGDLNHENTLQRKQQGGQSVDSITITVTPPTLSRNGIDQPIDNVESPKDQQVTDPQELNVVSQTTEAETSTETIEVINIVHLQKRSWIKNCSLWLFYLAAISLNISSIGQCMICYNMWAFDFYSRPGWMIPVFLPISFLSATWVGIREAVYASRQSCSNDDNGNHSGDHHLDDLQNVIVQSSADE